jgi:predicted RNase H-like HicB family nuclease/energy-coupling factor transporter ATP-binding protein EcfA2
MPDETQYTYRVMWSVEDGEHVATVTEFPSLSWLAPTPSEALEGLTDVVRDVIADLAESGEPIPEPLSKRTYSGKFVVRVPAEAHRRLALEAAEQQVSLNRLVSDRLARNHDRREFPVREVHGMEVGLRALRKATAASPSPDPGVALPVAIWETAKRLHARYEADLQEVVTDGHFNVEGVEARLSFPRKLDSFIPPAYRIARYEGPDMHLEREDEWQEREVRDDIEDYMMRHLESSYSTETPLLILGHPGSGKSLLTQVLAGRLAYPAYTTIRVKLRGYDPGKSLLTQLEEQVYEDTGGQRITWGEFARAFASTPPVVILDGYDELLQATGKTYCSFLDEIRQLQKTQLRVGQPMRVIVTSRVTLIDQVAIPDGTAVLRLEAFDSARRDRWVETWNDYNADYFRQSGVGVFQLPDNETLLDLASQPLLLLMLAIYDSARNELTSQPDIDQTSLYDKLLRHFIDRELVKRKDGTEYGASRRTGYAPHANALVEAEMARLGVAAIGMFNRQDVKISGGELNCDLRYFAGERGGLPTAGAVDQADLMFGSFFFINVSHGSPGPGQPSLKSTSPVAFEFLHKTFGEFLAADFILRRVLEEAERIASLSRLPKMAQVLDAELTKPHEAWLGCLTHTPLFTQPAILQMLRNWGRHRLGERREELLAALDQIVQAHLRIALNDLTVPAASDPRQPPYTTLPMRGRLVIYTLNLILLRAYVGGETYTLDERGLGRENGANGPWDGLTHLWRSWFTPEVLASLADMFSTRRDEHAITIVPADALARSVQAHSRPP